MVFQEGKRHSAPWSKGKKEKSYFNLSAIESKFPKIAREVTNMVLNIINHLDLQFLYTLKMELIAIIRSGKAKTKPATYPILPPPNR